MGAVYQAESGGRRVALKVIEPRVWRESPEARELLLQEGKVWEGLAHPNILKLHAVQEREGVLFLEMEFAGHGTLRSLIGHGLPAAQALGVFKSVCDGVAYLHEKSLVHRDLKPHNILFVQPGVPKVSDFGLAKVLTGKAATTLGGGTPGYWAPEQRRSRGRVSAATDVFALGVILFQVLTGELPPLDASEELAAEAGDTDRVRADLLGVIKRCVQSDPGKRFADAGELRAALEQL
jgi:serine/threonine protein kinase